MKFHILIFGCQMNYADSARIRVVLTNCWFSYTEKMEEADIVIFDTCSVRQKAEDKITGKLKTIKPYQKVRITGCMIQHTLRNTKLSVEPWIMKIGNFLWSLTTKNPEIVWITSDEINDLLPWTSPRVPINNAFNPLFHKLTQKWKNIELMWRIDDTGFLPLIVQRVWYKVTYDKELINEYEKIIPTWMPTSMNTHTTTAYIPISTGCNQFCAYCIVPYARGLERYFSVQQIIDEAKIHLQNGVKEIVLLGQIVNKHPEFVKIVTEILKLKWLKRLRYTSPYPTYYSKELLALHEKEEKLCPHIHMPLQSGSDSILKKMFRGYTIKQAKEWIDQIKKLKRDISITTDIIVGFPGETEQDFQETLKLVKYAKFDMIYIWIYSPRPGTLAAKQYPDDIPRSVKRDRRNRLNDLLTDISRRNNEKEVGKTRTVLINNIVWNPQKTWSMVLEWYTDNMKQIIWEVETERKQTKSNSWNTQPTINIGEFVQVKITKGVPFKLYGEEILS